MFDLKQKAMQEFLSTLQGLEQGFAAIQKFRAAVGDEVESSLLHGLITPGAVRHTTACALNQ